MTLFEADADPMMKGDTTAAVLKSKRQEEGAVLSLSGRVSLDELSGLVRETDAFFAQERPARLTMDLSALEYVDSAGALFLLDMERQARERSIPFEFLNMSPQVQSVVGLLDRDAIDQAPHPRGDQPPPGFFEGVGMGSMTFFDDIVRSITFGGTLIWEVGALDPPSFFPPMEGRRRLHGEGGGGRPAHTRTYQLPSRADHGLHVFAPVEAVRGQHVCGFPRGHRHGERAGPIITAIVVAGGPARPSRRRSGR